MKTSLLILVSGVLATLILSCNPSQQKFAPEEVRQLLKSHKEPLKKDWNYINEWDLNLDGTPELLCYNDQIIISQTETTTVSKPDYSNGCNIYQIVSKDSIRLIGIVYGKLSALSGSGFRPIESDIEIDDQNLTKTIIKQHRMFEKIEDNYKPKISLRTSYTFNERLKQYVIAEQRLMLNYAANTYRIIE